MDYRLVILAGTFLLLLIAVVVFLVTWVRWRRDKRDVGLRSPQATIPSAATGPLDTSLEGLELTVPADAPSASLLVPLRTGEWIPPESPAPVERLAEVALDERIANYQPAPNIPEPAFSVERYPEWEVPSAEQTAPTGPVLAALVPEVQPPEAMPAGSDDDFDAEIAALLPRPDGADEAAVSDEHHSPEQQDKAAEGLLPVPLVPEPPAAQQWVEEPEPELEPAPDPVPQLEPVSPQPAPAHVAAATPAIAPQSAAPAAPPTPQIAPQPAPVHVIPHVPETVAQPVPAHVASQSVPAPAIEPQSLPAPSQEEGGAEVWEDLLREQMGSPRPVAVAPAPVHRPPVTVSAAEPVAVPVTLPEPAATPRRARPVARVHGVEQADESPADAAPRVAPVSAQAQTDRANAPEIVMTAPVEMWFGNARVGVKAGTSTYDRFKKYADVLFEDLKASQSQGR